MAYIYDLTDTWNAGGTTFNGIKLNVTDSASAVSSKLVTLQTNGTEHFSVTKAGVGYVSGSLGVGTSAPVDKLSVTAGRIRLDQDYQIVWQNAGTNRARIAGDSGNNIIFENGSANTERMRITSTGLVGIGTSSPTQKLDVTGSANSVQARFGNVAGRGLTIGTTAISDTNDAGVVFNAPTTSGHATLIFQTNSTERMRIDASGNLLVGTTSIAGITDGSSTNVGTQIASGTVRSQRNDTAGLILSKATGYTSSVLAQFYVSGSSVGTISTTGSATAYNTSSDVRLKDNITDADDASNLIDAIQVRKFDWKADGSHQRYGFVAQELVTVAPEAVSQPEDPDAMMGVDYSKLVPMLVKEIQSMRLRLAQLEGN